MTHDRRFIYAVLGLLAPVAILGIVIYLAVRLAIRHENRRHPDP